MSDFDLYMPGAWANDGLIDELELQPNRGRAAPRRQPWLGRIVGVIAVGCAATAALGSGMFIGDEQPAVACLLELEHDATFEPVGPRDHDSVEPGYWQRLAERLASFRRVDEQDDGIELPDPFP